MALPSSLSEQTQNAEHARWFAEEVRPHEADLRLYLRRKFPSLFDLDDLIQETYARIFKSGRAGKLSDARPYLFATARNCAVDLFRHNQAVKIDSLGEMAEQSVVEDRPNAADALCHEQELEFLRDAIRTLPPRCCEVVTLRRIQGLTVREIAGKLGISEKTVDAQLCIGVFRLREYLKSHGVSRERLTQAKAKLSPP